MRWLSRILVLGVLLSIVALAGAVYLALGGQPLVTDVARLTPAQVERATQLLRAHDPRKLESGRVNRITLTDDELALTASYALSRVGTGGAKVRIADATLELLGTLELPRNPLARHVNVAAVIEQGDPLPSFQSLYVGKLPIPGWLANQALDRLVAHLYADRDLHAASEMIRAVQFSPGRMRVTYRWQEDTVKRLRARLVPEAEQARMRAYNDELVRVARDLAPGAGLDRLLTPLLALAGERGRDGDPVAENRAALMVLEAYVNGRDLGLLIPGAREWASPRKLTPRIQGRRDFPQHFMTSAVLAAVGGSALSDAVGLYKEVDDSRHGSGFSFTDLVADRAGTRFGELCVRSASSAARIQDEARRGLDNAALMPDALDLPEHMSEADFSRRFGGTDDPRYRKVYDEIERRIAALALYRS